MDDKIFERLVTLNERMVDSFEHLTHQYNHLNERYEQLNSRYSKFLEQSYQINQRVFDNLMYLSFGEDGPPRANNGGGKHKQRKHKYGRQYIDQTNHNQHQQSNQHSQPETAPSRTYFNTTTTKTNPYFNTTTPNVTINKITPLFNPPNNNEE